MECWTGHSLTLWSSITREFFSHDGHLYQESKRDRRVHPLYRSRSQDNSLSPRRGRKDNSWGKFFCGEKFVSFICCLLFIKLKKSFASPFNLLLIWKWAFHALFRDKQFSPCNAWPFSFRRKKKKHGWLIVHGKHSKNNTLVSKSRYILVISRSNSNSPNSLNFCVKALVYRSLHKRKCINIFSCLCLSMLVHCDENTMTITFTSSLGWRGRGRLMKNVKVEPGS